MRGKNEDTGEFLGASRSAQRREALDVLALAQQLVALDPGRLDKLPLGDDLPEFIERARRITSHIARKREIAFLAKQLRREDDVALDAIRDALEVDGEAARIDAARLHRAEDWRERLLGDDGDDALAALLEEFPGADRQRLRQLVRNALAERKANKPPRAFRELFREVRALLQPADSQDDHFGEGDGDREGDDTTP